MNPIEEIKQKIKGLEEDLKLEQDIFICNQHRRILLSMLKIVQATTEQDQLKRFRTVSEIYKDFHKAILSSQNMAERMEKGLERRSKFMQEKGVEEIYQALK